MSASVEHLKKTTGMTFEHEIDEASENGPIIHVTGSITRHVSFALDKNLSIERKKEIAERVVEMHLRNQARGRWQETRKVLLGLIPKDEIDRYRDAIIEMNKAVGLTGERILEGLK